MTKTLTMTDRVARALALEARVDRALGNDGSAVQEARLALLFPGNYYQAPAPLSQRALALAYGVAALVPISFLATVISQAWAL